MILLIMDKKKECPIAHERDLFFPLGICVT